jgi:hypothetical protein
MQLYYQKEPAEEKQGRMVSNGKNVVQGYNNT